MLILDTDHASELEHRSAAGLRLLDRLAAVGYEDAVISAITVEEQLRGRLAEIKRHTDQPSVIAAYARLIRQVELQAAWRILPWNQEAARVFERLRSLRLRTGAQALMIAAITLAHDATLLTRNTRDFAGVPGLKCENWLA